MEVKINGNNMAMSQPLVVSERVTETASQTRGTLTINTSASSGNASLLTIGE